jgi:hypothetical protein
MEDVNPSAASKHDPAFNSVLPSPGAGIWRDGELLVMHAAAVLPDRCVKCNAPAKARLKLHVSWMASLRLYGLSIPIVERYAAIKVGVCPHHLWQRRRRISIAWLLILLSFAAIVALLWRGDVNRDNSFGVMAYSVCMLLFIASGFCAAVFQWPPVKRQKVQGDYVWMRKVDPGYLAQLPPFPG